MWVCVCVWELQAESSKGFCLRLANEYVHFHLHCFFDNNDVPLGETKGAIDSRMCWASLQEVGKGGRSNCSTRGFQVTLDRTTGRAAD